MVALVHRCICVKVKREIGDMYGASRERLMAERRHDFSDLSVRDRSVSSLGLSWSR